MSSELCIFASDYISIEMVAAIQLRGTVANFIIFGKRVYDLQRAYVAEMGELTTCCCNRYQKTYCIFLL